MTVREYWVKLFQENDVALASAIHFCERFVDDEQLESGKDFIKEKIAQLDNIVADEIVVSTFRKR